MTDDAAEILVIYGADDRSDDYHHDCEYEIDRVLNSITTDLTNHVRKCTLKANSPKTPGRSWKNDVNMEKLSFEAKKAKMRKGVKGEEKDRHTRNELIVSAMSAVLL